MNPEIIRLVGILQTIIHDEHCLKTILTKFNGCVLQCKQLVRLGSILSELSEKSLQKLDEIFDESKNLEELLISWKE